jgi:hypothetical protein
MNERSSDHDELSRADGAQTQRTINEGLCPKCGYALRGLPELGACPECGAAYTPDTIVLLRVTASPLSLCLRFGWPVIGQVLLGSAIPIVSGSLNEGWFWPALTLLFLTPINAVIQFALLDPGPAASGEGRIPFRMRLHLLNRLALILFCVTFIAPFLIFGGCVVLMLSSL